MKTCVVAFSGGLDTSFLVPFVKEKYGFDRVITCTVNTGGFSESELKSIEARSKEVGADSHIAFDETENFYNDIIKFLIFGNVTRDGYPLCVGSERLVQGRRASIYARDYDALVHGSTGAGNDQYRFDLVARVSGVTCYAPVREFSVSRSFSTEYLKKLNISVPEKNTNYSYNVGLWGVSIGGKETLTSDGLIPHDAWYSAPLLNPKDSRKIEIYFERGEPVSADSVRGSLEVIKYLAKVGFEQGIGRGYHVGTSIPGKKGRLAYEAPAAELIYFAHRALEKHVLTQSQIQTKRFIADELGRLIHEAYFFDPVVDDLKAYLQSSQIRVTGKVILTLAPYRIVASQVESEFDLLSAGGATYGEGATSYSGADAAGASRLHGFEQELYWSGKD